MVLSKAKVQIQLAKTCMSNVEAAEKIGITPHRFLRIISGLNVTPKTAGRVARALNCDILEILADDQSGEA